MCRGSRVCQREGRWEKLTGPLCLDHGAYAAESTEHSPGEEIGHHVKKGLECQAKEEKSYLVEKIRAKAALGATWEVGGTLTIVLGETTSTETKSIGGSDAGDGVVSKA